MPGNKPILRSNAKQDTPSTSKTPNIEDYLQKQPGKKSKQVTKENSETRMAATDSSEMKTFISTSLRSLSDELMDKIDSNHVDIREDIQKLRSTLDSTLEAVEFNTAEIQQNKADIDKVRGEFEQRFAELEKKFLLQEMYQRKTNLLLYGIPDDRDAETAGRDIFKTLGLKHDIDLVAIHRLPRLSTSDRTAAQPKPIVIKFAKMSDRQDVINASYKPNPELRKKRITIRTDLPVSMKKYRTKLANTGYEIRKELKAQTRIQQRGIDLNLQCRKNSTSPWINVNIEKPVTSIKM